MEPDQSTTDPDTPLRWASAAPDSDAESKSSNSGDESSVGSRDDEQSDYGPDAIDEEDLPTDLEVFNDLPDFANSENRKLNRQVLEKEDRIDKVKKAIVVNKERLKVMVEHLKNVEQELVHTQGFLTAKTKEAKTEEHLKQLAERELGRINLEIKSLGGKKEEIIDKLSVVQNSIYKNNEKLDQFKLAMNWNQEELEQWVLAARQKEEDNLAIEKYTRADEAKIKDLNLQIEKYTEMANAKAKDLEREVTETQAKQIELDKTAEEFRNLHQERQDLVRRWQESIDTLKKRDADIQDAGQEFARMIAQTEEIQTQLEGEKSRLEMVQQDNQEMDSKSKMADRLLQKKRGELQIAKKYNGDYKAELELVKIELRETQNCVEVKKKCNEKLTSQIEEEKMKLRRARERFVESTKLLEKEKNEMLTVEEMAKASEQQIKHKEVELKEAQKCLAALKERMFKQGQELFQLRQRESNLKAEISGAQASNKNLSAQIHKLDEESLHQQELVYTAEFQIQQLERKVARASGVRSDEEKKALNRRIAECKEELQRATNQHSMLMNQYKKLQDELRRTRRKEQTVKEQKKEISARISNLELESSSAEINLNEKIKEREEVLVQHDLLKLEVKRLKELLSSKADNLFSLENRKYQLEMSMQERKKEIKVHQTVQRAKAKAAEEERHNLKLEVNTRRTKLDKLKAKYATIANDNGEDGEKRSQAYYVIAAAQQREELQREGDELDASIRKLQREIKALSVTLKKLNVRNTKYRASFLAVDPTSEECKDLNRLDESIKETKSKIIKKRKELQRLESEIEDDKLRIKQTENQMESMEKHIASLVDAKTHVALELEDYDQQVEKFEEKITEECINHRKSLGLKDSTQSAIEHQFFIESKYETCNNVLYTIGQLAKEFPEINGTLNELLQKNGLDAPLTLTPNASLVM